MGIEEAKNNLKNAKKVVYTGTPSKVKPVSLSENEKNKIRNDLKLNPDLPLVFVFGGSQGAKVINNAVVEIAEKKLNTNYQLLLATGQEQYEDVKQKLKETGCDIDNLQNTKIYPYIYDITEILSLTNLVVARSGAMTLTELAIMGKPAIFVPLPSSSSNRQEDNARVFEKRGAAKVILNDELNGNLLNKEIIGIINNNNILEKMGKEANIEKLAYK